MAEHECPDELTDPTLRAYWLRISAGQTMATAAKRLLDDLATGDQRTIRRRSRELAKAREAWANFDKETP